ncbi:MAG: hypothetical protein V1754_04585 [Pseudomonadota bacterium]
MALSRQVRRLSVQLALRAFRRTYKGLRPSAHDAQAVELATGDVLIHITFSEPVSPKTAWLVRANTTQAIEIDEEQVAQLMSTSART